MKSCAGIMLLLSFMTCTYHELPNPNPEPAPSSDTYLYHPDSTTLKWTAYKYSSMLGVSGTFNQIEVGYCVPALTARSAIENMTFSINTQTIDSGSAFRDTNILDYFFSQLQGGQNISGKINRFVGDSEEGIVYINLVINDVEREISFEYHIEDSVVHVEGDFSLADFAAIEALDYMENCCRELHTGSDGIHLLWPDIRLEISTNLK